jgi:hypothetical protein
MKSALFLLISLLYQSEILSQNIRKAFFDVSITGHFPKDLGNGIGFKVAGNAKLGQGVYLGGGVEIIKFSNVNPPYFPLSGILTAFLTSNHKKITPVIQVAPGYGLYYDRISQNTSVQGGFTFSGYGGVQFPSVKGMKNAYFMVGYSSFGFKNNGSYTTDNNGNDILKARTNYSGISIKFGVFLK